MIQQFLLILALVCFLLASSGITTQWNRLVSFGFAALTAAALFGGR